jgi:hypothetical protein
MSKLKEVLFAYEALSAEERSALQLLLKMLHPEEAPKATPRPSQRGKFSCDVAGCTEVFRTSRGLGVHKGHLHKKGA